MDKKNNMKQAMYEMFGVGADQNEKEVPVKRAAEPARRPEAPVEIRTAPAAYPEKKSAAPVSYFAPGTFFEGTLRASGDIEIAGEFKGDITTDGVVVLRSTVQGNIAAKTVKIAGCSLTGDVSAADTVLVGRDAVVCGNIAAREVQVSGQITGDLKIGENTELEGSAQVTGRITTGTIVVAKGAVICGGIDIKASPAAAKTGAGK